MIRRRANAIAGLALVAALFGSPSLAQEVDVPLRNWTVPPYAAAPAAGGGLTAMTDVGPPRAFVAVAPCRVADTRGIDGFTGQAGGPALSSFANRNFQITGSPSGVPAPPNGCPAGTIPTGADAVSVQFTIVAPTASGNLVAWNTGGSTPNVSVLNWDAGTVAQGSGTIIPLSAAGALTVRLNTAAAGQTAHLVIDVNGYFSDLLSNPANSLLLINNSPGTYTAAFGNLANANNSSGVVGTAGTGFARPSYLNAGVRGESQMTGVLGISNFQGIAGSLLDGAGNELAWGVVGFHVGNTGDPAVEGRDVGVFGTTNVNAAQTAGVIGYAPAVSGAIAGVRGVTGSSSVGAAGVRGQDGGGQVPLLWPGIFTFTSAGVRGESHGSNGVLGVTDLGVGVRGFYSLYSEGVLGYSSTVGVYSSDDIQAVGNKSFIEPHPSDPSKIIRYIALEGNEPGTYFRGRGRFQNGLAVIDVPEDFRIVTDPEGLSIQVTPIGQMATVAVESIGLDRIVVRGSRNVEFFYLVNGVRHAYRDSGPYAENEKQFVPESPDDLLPRGLPDSLKQRLVSNGTYRPDGTVNLETARRLGWDKVWEARRRPNPQPAEP